MADETSELTPPDGENSEIKSENKCCSILNMKSVEPSEMYTNSEVHFFFFFFLFFGPHIVIEDFLTTLSLAGL